MWCFSPAVGAVGCFRQAADGTGQVEQLMQSSNLLTPWTWSADGRLVYVESGLGGRDIVALTVDSERSTEVLLAEEFAEQRPAISPDGRWIAYQSDESGQYEVYVRPFPNVDAGKSTVSTGGGAHPVWSPDGEELFYLSPDDQADNLMVVQVDTEPTFSAGTPEIVFGTRGYVLPVASPRIFDISADGQRFLMLKAEERRTTQDENSPQLIVVQNWFEELKRLVPIP